MTNDPSGRAPARQTSRGSEIDLFLGHMRDALPTVAAEGAGRLVFALDATMSRQPTWDIAARLQARMFAATAAAGPLLVQLVYFRGFSECRASRWVNDPDRLTTLMTGLECRGGLTQIERVLRHVAELPAGERPRVLVYVGDACEEALDTLCSQAGRVALTGVRAFMFQEGRDPDAHRAFAEIARLTSGVHAPFDAAAPDSLALLLQAAAAYATGGRDGMLRLAGPGAAVARRLAAQMPGG